MSTKGYMGKVLRVDLSAKKIREDALSDRTAELFIGGSGFGARILYDETKPDTDPLGPENPLIFAVGPLTGTQVFNSCRFQVVTKSPLTGIFAESNSGGYWGEVFKKCGYDAMVVEGRSDRPVYVSIDEQGARIEDAGHIWGKETFEAERVLREKHGKTAEVAVIGPAGENLVKIAGIVTDALHGRSAARCGVGAVMGSKKLKGVVVNGKKDVPVADEERIKQLMKTLAPFMKKDVALAIHDYGTSAGVEYSEEIGNLPVKNWYQGSWPEGARKISGQAMAKSILVDRYHCGRCVMSCGRTVEAKDGPLKGTPVGGPEYETIGLLGSNLLIDDISAIAKSNELCNRLGLDTISTGGVIGFAMEAYERGLVTRKDLGLDLAWGNAGAVHEMIGMIAGRKGFGDILADGVVRAAERIGGTAAEFAVHVKGLEPPAHDPRAKMTVAVGFATSNRGACHLQAFTHDFEEGIFIKDLGLPQLTDRFTPEGKADNVIRMQHPMTMLDSLTCCKFALFAAMAVRPLSDFVEAVIGWTSARMAL